MSVFLCAINLITYKMNIKRSITFILETRKKEGKYILENIPIRMRVTYSGNRIEFFTGYRIDHSKWDLVKQRVKNGCSNKLKQSASEINANLLQYYSDIQSIFKEFEVKNLVPAPTEVRSAFDSMHKQNKSNTNQNNFSFVFDEFIKENGAMNNWSASTYKKFATTRNHLRDFDPNLSFQSITESNLTNYVNYLRDSKGLMNSTIEKQISFLKWFLRWCLKKQYINNNTFETFKPKLKNTSKKVIFLTWEELTKLRNYEIPGDKKYLDRVRDVFLFCCFTGLRYSDVANLKKSDIKNNHIEVTTIKTADSLVIELNDHSRGILDKYNDVYFEENKALPVISNQKMNDYLKELAQLAEINEPIRETYYKGNERIDVVSPKYALLGTHAGRRTFICNALSLGIPAQVVMKWTGHSDYKAMKPYIDIADNIKANAMEKFNNLK